MKVVSLTDYREKKREMLTIEDLPLYVRTYNILKRNNISTLKELKEQNPSKVAQFRGVNESVLENLQEVTGIPYMNFVSELQALSL